MNMIYYMIAMMAIEKKTKQEIEKYFVTALDGAVIDCAIYKYIKLDMNNWKFELI